MVMVQKTKKRKKIKTLAGEKVLIGLSSFSAIDHSPMDRLRETGCEIIDNPFKRRLTKPKLLGLLASGITGLIAGLEPLDREVLEKSKLKVISRCGAGLSNVDLKAAEELGISIFSTPDATTTAVAELTVGALLCMLRMIPEMDRALHRGKWTKKIGVQLEGKTVVIIGFGRIGRKVASLLKPFNVGIIAVDPDLNESVEGIKVCPLEEALKIADIIAIHASGQRRIIGRDEFKLMKRGAFLLNAARGELVDENSLIQALEKGKIRGAWLDTFGKEPYSGPLIRYPQVILTPHIGSYTLKCRRSMEMQAVNNLIVSLAGKK